MTCLSQVVLFARAVLVLLLIGCACLIAILALCIAIVRSLPTGHALVS